MSIKKAILSDADIVKKICSATISEIYPHYYPQGAVSFFLAHHSISNIVNDIRCCQVFLYLDAEQNCVGTMTIKDNAICRLFVLPAYKGRGYGREMLNYAESLIFEQYNTVILDSSLPAKIFYRKRGYQETESHRIAVEHNDVLCYDSMVKYVKEEQTWDS